MKAMVGVFIGAIIVAVVLIIISAMTIDRSNETLERTQWVERYGK